MRRDDIELAPMTDSMYRDYFREYENDPDLYMEGQTYEPYVYSEEKAERYIQRQKLLKRIPLAIIYGGEAVGEIIIKDIKQGESAVMGISLKNASYKDQGIGTEAERLAAEYVFNVLDIPVLYADCLKTNGRSRRVLEKTGFTFLREDGEFIYYRKERQDSGDETTGNTETPV